MTTNSPAGRYGSEEVVGSVNTVNYASGNFYPKDKQIGGEHYKNMKIQPSEFIVANELGWYEGNAVKYICRHRVKGGKQDLEKAIHYLELALEEYDD